MKIKNINVAFDTVIVVVTNKAANTTATPFDKNNMNTTLVRNMGTTLKAKIIIKCHVNMYT